MQDEENKNLNTEEEVRPVDLPTGEAGSANPEKDSDLDDEVVEFVYDEDGEETEETEEGDND